MVKLNYAILAQQAFLTDSGLPNIVGLITRAYSDKVPAMNDAYLVIDVSTDDIKEHSLVIKFKNPSGEEVKKAYENKLGPAKDEKTPIGLLIDIKKIILEKAGTYIFEIYVDNNLLGKVPLEFSITK